MKKLILAAACLCSIVGSFFTGHHYGKIEGLEEGGRAANFQLGLANQQIRTQEETINAVVEQRDAFMRIARLARESSVSPDTTALLQLNALENIASELKEQNYLKSMEAIRRR